VTWNAINGLQMHMHHVMKHSENEHCYNTVHTLTFWRHFLPVALRVLHIVML